MPPIVGTNGSTCTIYESNPAWVLGKALYFTRFDKITSFNGGTGSVIVIKDLTEYTNNEEPSSGIWIVGQRIKKSSNVGTSIGWICTASGTFETASNPTFRELEV